MLTLQGQSKLVAPIGGRPLRLPACNPAVDRNEGIMRSPSLPFGDTLSAD